MSPRASHKKKLSDAALEHAAECLRTIAHPARLRMLEALLKERLTVGELAELCAIAPHQASEHLRLLRDRGLLQNEREGRFTYHAVADPGIAGILDCVRGRFGSL